MAAVNPAQPLPIMMTLCTDLSPSDWIRTHGAGIQRHKREIIAFQTEYHSDGGPAADSARLFLPVQRILDTLDHHIDVRFGGTVPAGSVQARVAVYDGTTSFAL